MATNRTIFFLVFPLFISAALCAQQRAAKSLPAPSIAVFYSFDRTPAPDLVSEMQNELARIMAPSGLQLAWRQISDNSGTENYPEVVVMRFRGNCTIPGPAYYGELGGETTVHELAQTHRTDGKVLPFGEVECDHLSRYLAPLASAERVPARNGLLGRAMARVVAHEMYHMLAGSSCHGKHGIARASHSREDLTAKKFDFAKSEIDWLREWNSRAALAGEGLSPSDVPGVASGSSTDSGR